MKKVYLQPRMANQSAWVDMPLLQTVPVSGGTTTGQLTKDRQEDDYESFEEDVEVGIILGEFEEPKYGDLW